MRVCQSRPLRASRDASIETTALANRRKQLLETEAGDAGAGTAQIIVNDFYSAPAQSTRDAYWRRRLS